MSIIHLRFRHCDMKLIWIAITAASGCVVANPTYQNSQDMNLASDAPAIHRDGGHASDEGQTTPKGDAGNSFQDGVAPYPDFHLKKGDKGSIPPNPCVPLPAACACQEACKEGSCDNSLCPCEAIPNVAYHSLRPNNPYAGNVAKHGDINLLLRAKQSVDAEKTIIWIEGPMDPLLPPQIASIFEDNRLPIFSNVYQLQRWDWDCNCPKEFMTTPEVTLLGMAVKRGEILRTPKSDYDIGKGNTALLLYATKHTVTLKYTADDDVIHGYTVHIDGICVEPSLQKMYDRQSLTGRVLLPALSSEQPIGRAFSTELRIAIRVDGTWLDPRSKKDWWRGK